MALQTSGAISISQIKTELGSSSNSLRALSAAAGKSTPDAMSEFYGFASYTPPSYSGGAAAISGSGTQASPYVVTTSWSGTRGVVIYNPPDDGGSLETIYRNTVSMTQLNFTNNTAAQQRVNVTYAVSANFCSYAGQVWDYGYGDPHYAQSCIYLYGETYNSHCSNGSSSPQALANGQTKQQTFTKSVGSNLNWGGSGFQDTFLFSNPYQAYFFPCGESNYGQVPSPSISVTLTIWFELV